MCVSLTQPFLQNFLPDFSLDPHDMMDFSVLDDDLIDVPVL
jgi:hypothetical protein